MEGDGWDEPLPSTDYNFYPRPPGGGRRCLPMWALQGLLYFYPRPPGGGRLFQPCHPCRSMCNFYPRPPGGGRHVIFNAFYLKTIISIHALRVEGDAYPGTKCVNKLYFYPRPPGGGRQQKRTKFSSVFAKKGEEFASLRRGKRKICRWRFKKDKFWVLIWCEGSRKSVCALASHCG